MDEADLRDALIADLSVLESGMTLLKKEQYLPNDLGTRGFIDILAQDIGGNFVLIEVKLTKHAERDAITELMKYFGLVKRYFGLKESEIRMFVVSADWRELSVPFAEFVAAVDFNVEGFRVHLGDGAIVSVERETPLPPGLGRELLPRHWVQFYTQKEERDLRADEYAKAIQARRIKNFIMVHIEMDHGFIFYFAQRKEERSFHEAVLRDFVPSRYEETMEVIEDYEPDDALNEIADASTDLIRVRADEIEIGHPEKFKGWYQHGAWRIERIVRYGIFSKDPRLTDELIINDLCGYSGQSYSWYTAIAKSGDKAKRAEIVDQYANCLFHNDVWRNTIRDILDWETKSRSAPLAISIFNPENIIESIYLIAKTGAYSYLPKYTVISDGPAGLHIFHGDIVSTGKTSLTWSALNDKHFDGDESNYYFASHLHGIYEMNEAILSDLGLRYTTIHQVFTEDGVSEGIDPIPRGSNFRSTPYEAQDHLVEWMQRNPELVIDICRSYATHVHYGPGMEPK